MHVPNLKEWRAFFEEYRNLPVLWKFSCEDYKNRTKKTMAWKKLLEKYQPLDPEADIRSLKSKICNLRTCYKRELRKKLLSSSEGDEHVPTLWYFEFLDFLKDEDEFAKAPESCNLRKFTKKPRLASKRQFDESDSGTDQSLNEKESIQYKSSTSFHQPNKEYLEQDSDLITEELEMDQTFKTWSIEDDEPESKINFKYENPCLFESNRKIPQTRHRSKVMDMQDEADIFGQSWAYSFRKMPEDQKLFAKRIIDEALALGQVNRLCFSSVDLLRPQRHKIIKRSSVRNNVHHMPACKSSPIIENTREVIADSDIMAEEFLETLDDEVDTKTSYDPLEKC